MIKNHIITKIMLYFKSLLLNEWPTFRIYRFLFRIWHVLKLLKTHISLENFVMIFLTLLPLKLNTLAENGPFIYLITFQLINWLINLFIYNYFYFRFILLFHFNNESDKVSIKIKSLLISWSILSLPKPLEDTTLRMVSDIARAAGV